MLHVVLVWMHGVFGLKLPAHMKARAYLEGTGCESPKKLPTCKQTNVDATKFTCDRRMLPVRDSA